MQSINNYWVAKFGGTSVATYTAMVRCAKIIMQYPDVRVIVVSAPAGITNLLIKLSQSSINGTNTLVVLDEIKIKIHSILSLLSPEVKETQCFQEVEQLLQNLARLASTLNSGFSDSLVDELLSHGERISARIFACVLLEQDLPAIYQDARFLIKTSDLFGKAEVLLEETKKQVADLVLPRCKKHIIVTEGFIGSTLQNITTTLGRGGSDYSSAVLAEAMNAEVLQIWTDVSGIYTADPRLVAEAKPIDNMCFTEAAELAQFGAKVLHPATLWPAIRKNIPVFVGSSMNPQGNGTWIRANTSEQKNAPLVRAISLRKNQSLLTINSLEMLHAHGFLANVFNVLARHKLSVDLVTTSEVSIALTLNHSEAGAEELLTPDILAELRAIGNVSLTIDKNLCLIALVGNQLHMKSGVSGRVFKRLSEFNIRLICHGASPYNLCFLVNDCDAKTIIQRMHAEFFDVND